MKTLFKIIWNIIGFFLDLAGFSSATRLLFWGNKCNKCGSKNLRRLNNGSYLCLDCGNKI